MTSMLARARCLREVEPPAFASDEPMTSMRARPCCFGLLRPDMARRGFLPFRWSGTHFSPCWIHLKRALVQSADSLNRSFLVALPP
jgi:hypothetical protein